MQKFMFSLLSLLPCGIAVGLLLWSRARRAKRQSHSGGPPVRVAVLVPSQAESATLAITLFALLPLVLVSIVLAARWNAIPARFPIHWGFDGRPNGWAARTPLSVFGPLACGMVLIGCFALIGWLTGRYSPGFTGRHTMLRQTSTTLCAVAWLISLLFCAVGILALVRVPATLLPLMVAIPLLSSAALVVFVVYQALRVPENVLVAAQQTTEGRYWRASQIYWNPADSALLVPKRSGLGYTMNFARPSAWAILGGILLVALVLPVMLYTAAH